MRTSIWLVRHAQTQFNLERRYQSSSDSPITAYGERQMAALAARLRRIPFTEALISPTARTRAAAEMILAGRSGVNIQVDPAWAETNHGRWEGLTYREVMARYGDEARARWTNGINGRPQGGESLADVAARVGAAWNQLRREPLGRRMLIVTHATPIQLVICACTGMPPNEHWRWRIDTTGITSIDLYGAGPIIRMINNVPRLDAATDSE
ncbi:MAG: histidine phosphatase family protein [Oscillochloris sp.]|nr:histidine phosphatase family protein [Oscillochloris sp.]